MPRSDGRPTTTERGYGNEHQTRRRALRVLVESGSAVCSRCGRPIAPGTPWDLDHTPDRSGYLGPAHRSCNRAAGARVANRRRARRTALIRSLRANASRQW